MIIELIKGVALLLALSLLQSFVRRYWRQNEILGQMVSGVLFGGICVIGMETPLEVVPGVIFDARSIVLSMSGLFGGPVVGAIAAVIAGGYRAWIGGAGATVGVAVIVSSVVLGLAYRYCHDRGWVKVGVIQLLAFGLIVHGVVVLLFTQLPPDVVQKVMDNVAVPLLLTFTPATAFLGILLQDINNRVATETALYEVQERFRAFADHAPIKLHIKDTKGRYILINRKSAELFGVTNEYIRGKTAGDIFPPERAEAFNAQDRIVLETGRPAEMEEEFPTGDSVHTYLTVKFPILGANGDIVAIGSSGIDITERKKIELELLKSHDDLERRVEDRTLELSQEVAERKRAEERAEFASHSKSSLLANMSHEFRTPLNAIIGFSDAMIAETFGPLGDEKYREYMDDIHHSGQHLLELINDILDVSAIEADGLELYEENFSLKNVVDASIRMVSPQATIAQVSVASAVDTGTPQIRADERRVKQILLNLLGNAVKFTPQGGAISVNSHLNDDGSLAITVADSGIGMNDEDVALAMSTFGQVDSGLDRRHDGAGLGLPLTNGLMELHGGTLDVKSEKGHGTLVTVTFPKERVVQSDG